MKKRRQRLNETLDQKKTRNAKDVVRKKKRIIDESESEKKFRLSYDAKRKRIKRINETSSERTERLKKCRENVQNKFNNLEKDYEWPKPISSDVKRKCLVNFVKMMSKDALLQSTCCLCNRTDFNSAFTKRKFGEIASLHLVKFPYDLYPTIFGMHSTCYDFWPTQKIINENSSNYHITVVIDNIIMRGQYYLLNEFKRFLHNNFFRNVILKRRCNFRDFEVCYYLP